MAFTLTAAYTWTDGDLITAARLALTATPTLAAAQTYAFGDGTAAAPSVTFNSDSDNGFYFVAANSFGIACAGSSIGFFNSSGLQGCAIGATSPSTGAFTTVTSTSTATFGVAKTGTGLSSLAEWSHSTVFGTASYGMLQDATGFTCLNAATGQSLFLRINNATIASIVSTGLTMATGTVISLGNSYVATPQACTGTVTIKDFAGVTYKVLVST